MVKNLMPWQAPVDAGWWTKQSAKQTSPFTVKLTQVVMIYFAVPCSKACEKSNNRLKVSDAQRYWHTHVTKQPFVSPERAGCGYGELTSQSPVAGVNNLDANFHVEPNLIRRLSLGCKELGPCGIDMENQPSVLQRFDQGWQHIGALQA